MEMCSCFPGQKQITRQHYRFGGNWYSGTLQFFRNFPVMDLPFTGQASSQCSKKGIPHCLHCRKISRKIPAFCSPPVIGNSKGAAFNHGGNPCGSFPKEPFVAALPQNATRPALGGGNLFDAALSITGFVLGKAVIRCNSGGGSTTSRENGFFFLASRFPQMSM